MAPGGSQGRDPGCAGGRTAVSERRQRHCACGDQGITEKKLLLKVGKVVLLSKDASISIAGSDPVDGTDSSVSFDAGSGPVTLTLPASLWSTNGSGTLFKYKNAQRAGRAVWW